jgi:hypothetical protein
MILVQRPPAPPAGRAAHDHPVRRPLTAVTALAPCLVYRSPYLPGRLHAKTARTAAARYPSSYDSPYEPIFN